MVMIKDNIKIEDVIGIIKNFKRKYKNSEQVLTKLETEILKMAIVEVNENDTTRN